MQFLILLTLSCIGTLNQEATAVPELVTGTIIEQIGHSTILVEGVLKLVIKFQAPLKLFSQILHYEEMLKELGQAISNLTDLKPSHERLFIGTELARMINVEIEILKGKIDTLLKLDWIKPSHEEAPPAKRTSFFFPNPEFKFPIRDKRGTFDFGGIFLGNLFGLATEGDLKAIDKKLDVVSEAVKASNTAMIQLNHNEKYIKEQIEIMKGQLNKQAQTIQEIDHLQWLNERYTLFKFQLITMEKFFDFLLKLDEEINALLAGSQGNSLHLIPRTLFPFEMFKKINSATEEKLNMKSVAPLNLRTFPYYLNAARIFPGTQPMTMLMIIPYATEKTYDTYKFHSFPTFHKDIPDYRVLLNFKLPYMLLSNDLKTITHLDENDFRLCTHVFTPESTYLCFLSHPLYNFPLGNTLDLAPHRCQETIIRKSSTEECSFDPYTSNDTLVKRVGTSIYLSSVTPLQAVVNCPTGNTQPLLKELTVLAPGCSFTTSGLSLLNFREVKADLLVQLTTHEIPLLNALEYSDKFPMETTNSTPVIKYTYQEDLIRKKIEESEKLLDKAQNMPKYVPLTSVGFSVTTLLIISGLVIYFGCRRKVPRYSEVSTKTIPRSLRCQSPTPSRTPHSLSRSNPNISKPTQLELLPIRFVNPPVQIPVNDEDYVEMIHKGNDSSPPSESIEVADDTSKDT